MYVRNIICKCTQWSDEADSDTQEEGTKGLEVLLETVGLEVMPEIVRVATHLES